MNIKHHHADASANTKKPNRPRYEGKTRMPAQSRTAHMDTNYKPFLEPYRTHRAHATRRS
jgi:hypothetical protein